MLVGEAVLDERREAVMEVACMAKGFLPYSLDQRLLLAPDIVTSSRKLEQKTTEDVAFRVLSGDQHSDHDSIASFRQRHLGHLGGWFAEVLVLCQKAGLVELGHVAIDGTTMGANASKQPASTSR
jgi:transposase